MVKKIILMGLVFVLFACERQEGAVERLQKEKAAAREDISSGTEGEMTGVERIRLINPSVGIIDNQPSDFSKLRMFLRMRIANATGSGVFVSGFDNSRIWVDNFEVTASGNKRSIIEMNSYVVPTSSPLFRYLDGSGKVGQSVVPYGECKIDLDFSVIDQSIRIDKSIEKMRPSEFDELEISGKLAIRVYLVEVKRFESMDVFYKINFRFNADGEVDVIRQSVGLNE